MSTSHPTFFSQLKSLPRAAVVATITGVVAVSAASGYWLASQVRKSSSPATTAVAGTAQGTGRKILYWYDPMQPERHFDRPGKSPFMDMALTPRYADESAAIEGVRISSAVTQNLGLRLATVERGVVPQSIDAVGTVGFNQRNVAIVQTRTGGFVSRVYDRAPGDVVSRGAPLADLLVPEWAGAQSEFLALLASGDQQLIDAARQRLVLLGMPDELILQVQASGRPQATVTIGTPLGGVIDSLDVRPGMTMASGATLARINGLDTVWLEAAVPEAQGSLTGLGKYVDLELAAYPAEKFRGRVIAILPEASAESRTVRIRIEIPNPSGRLRPGMFARAHVLLAGTESTLLVPSEAIIRTGTRTVVIVAGSGDRFEPREIQTGAEGQGRTAVSSGLSAGERVVASGQFLIDSEANLRGVLARMAAEQPSGGAR